MRVVLRLLFAEAGCAPLLPAGVLVLFSAVLVGGSADASTLSPGWSDPLNRALTACVLLAPVIAGTSAWRAQQLVAGGFLHLTETTGRQPAAPVLLTAAAAGCWGLAGLLTVAVLAAARGRTDLLPGPADALLAVLAAAYLVGACLFGAMVGRRAAARAVAPAVAVTVLAWAYVLSYAPDGIARLSPIYPATFYQPYFQPRVVVVLLQTALWVALSALATAALLRRRAAWTAGSSAAVVVVALLVAVPRQGPADVALRPAPDKLACVAREGTTLCVWPENVASAPASAEALSRVVDQVEGLVPGLPDRYAEPGLLDRRLVGVGVWRSPRLGAADADGLVLAAIDAVTPVSDCGPTDEAALVAGSELRLLVAARVLGSERVLGEATQRTEIEAVLTDRALRRGWVEQRIRVATSCSGN